MFRHPEYAWEEVRVKSLVTMASRTRWWWCTRLPHGPAGGCDVHACYRDIMHQLTLRVPAELAEHLKAAAHDHKDSVNGYAVKVLSAAVDPDYADDEITGLRERLRRAGLLLNPERLPTAKRPSARAISHARAAAGRGRQLSDFVAEDRR